MANPLFAAIFTGIVADLCVKHPRFIPDSGDIVEKLQFRLIADVICCTP